MINLKGEVVGLMLQSYSTREAQSTVTAISISQISKLLEKNVKRRITGLSWVGNLYGDSGDRKIE